jgi:hypothetical protein
VPFIQDLLHKLEVGGGIRCLRWVLAVLAIVLLVGGYNLRAFRNMSTPEAMDAAQLARNIAQGKGYTTLFVRPFSMFLVKQHNLEKQGVPPVGKLADLAEIRGMHPDLANPPVYPVVLAALMKVLPFKYEVDTAHAFWSIFSSGKRIFYRYEPDFLISLFNQLLFLGVIVLVFFLARRLFDPGVAWLSAGLLLGTELLWRFSVSGLSTMLLMTIFLGLIWCVVLLEQETRLPKWGSTGILILAGLAGAIVGLGGLTRYAFGWLIIPVVGFLILFGGQRRILLTLIALMAFAAMMTPWIVRNYSVSGRPFGTATYVVLEKSILYPENQLERTLEPDFRASSPYFLPAFWLKLKTNLQQIVTNDFPRLGGSWITAFFLVGLLVGFHNPAVARLRYFLLGCGLVFTLAQALGRTQLSEESPELNSENLLVLLVPLVFVYGVSLFYLLLEQMPLPLLQLRFLVIGIFTLVACLPMVFVLLPPMTRPIAYPPYYPPRIQTMAGYLEENELVMSDVPWAVAWYGQRQSVWLTLRCMPDTRDTSRHEDFFAINNHLKQINALYLTPETMDARFLTQFEESDWSRFIVRSVVEEALPDEFPLRQSPTGWPSGQLVLTDRQRW